MGETRILIRFLGCIFHGTGNSARLCQNFGIRGLNPSGYVSARYRRQDKVRKEGRIVCGEKWKEKIYNREQWKKLVRTVRKRHILHMPMERMRG
jgi:hypothetical protein